MISTREFDAFGPWIDEVHSVDDLPRLFRGAGLDPAASRLVLKVPRDIERRNANPDMHLYDYLIALDTETITVLGRTGETYRTVRLPLDQVVAIQDSVRLLDGRLTIHAVDGSAHTVTYNGSANAPIRNLVRLVRERYLPGAATAGGEPERIEAWLDREDTGLVTDFRHLIRAEPWLRLVQVAGRQVVTPAALGERLYRKLWPVVLHASIVVADAREVQVIHRRDWFTPAGDDLSLARTVLPRARITEVSARPHERYRGVEVLTVRSGNAAIEFPVAGSAGALVAGVTATGMHE